MCVFFCFGHWWLWWVRHDVLCLPSWCTRMAVALPWVLRWAIGRALAACVVVSRVCACVCRLVLFCSACCVCMAMLSVLSSATICLGTCDALCRSFEGVLACSFLSVMVLRRSSQARCCAGTCRVAALLKCRHIVCLSSLYTRSARLAQLVPC